MDQLFDYVMWDNPKSAILQNLILQMGRKGGEGRGGRVLIN